MQPRKITLEEVKAHATAASLWIVIHNDVLDVTPFQNEHPGGSKQLMKYAGLDATQAFEEVGHSHEARAIAEQYKIGWLPPPERTRFNESVSSLSTKSSGKMSPKSSCTSKEKTLLKPTPKSWVSKNSREAKRHNLYGAKRGDSGGGGGGGGGRSKLKWVILALAVAIIAGLAYKRFSNK